MNNLNHYKMEELVPIVGKLAEKYTAGESTSISYEKAEQLMGAVVYCIQEAGQSWEESAENIVEKVTVRKTAVEPAADQSPTEPMAVQSSAEKTKSTKSIFAVSITKTPETKEISAQQAYETGIAKVREKTRRALQVYNQLLPEFNCYGSHCLYDTVIKGLPEFFKWYDISFNPQDTILTLDYPVLKDQPNLTGIDRIYEYIRCIGIEQMFLNHMPEEYVTTILRSYHAEYEELLENISEIVFQSAVGHILAEKPLSEPDLTKDDYRIIQNHFAHPDSSEPEKQLKQTIQLFLEQYYGASASTLLDYFQGAIDSWIIRLKNTTNIH
ncbi:MAG: hypothetical protein HFI75_02095 [Lachnospiraceae bacterium]|nr:hypothetical protein [Lachnospiraceae bacterium]